MSLTSNLQCDVVCTCMHNYGMVSQSIRWPWEINPQWALLQVIVASADDVFFLCKLLIKIRHQVAFLSSPIDLLRLLSWTPKIPLGFRNMMFITLLITTAGTWLTFVSVHKPKIVFSTHFLGTSECEITSTLGHSSRTFPPLLSKLKF